SSGCATSLDTRRRRPPSVSFSSCCRRTSETRSPHGPICPSSRIRSISAGGKYARCWSGPASRRRLAESLSRRPIVSELATGQRTRRNAELPDAIQLRTVDRAASEHPGAAFLFQQPLDSGGWITAPRIHRWRRTVNRLRSHVQRLHHFRRGGRGHGGEPWRREIVQMVGVGSGTLELLKSLADRPVGERLKQSIEP